MSDWRSNLHGHSQSVLELEVWKALSSRDLHPVTYHHIPLYWTVPDFFWDMTVSGKPLCVFLDGEEVHRDIDKDEAVQRRLEKLGFIVRRYRYNGRVNQERFGEILDEVEDLVRGSKYKELKVEKHERSGSF